MPVGLLHTTPLSEIPPLRDFPKNGISNEICLNCREEKIHECFEDNKYRPNRKHLNSLKSTNSNILDQVEKMGGGDISKNPAPEIVCKENEILKITPFIRSPTLGRIYKNLQG